MYLFLITFLLIYASMHLYAFFKLRNVFNPRPYLTWLLILWMSIMTVAPLLVRGAEQFGMGKTAIVLAWPGYLWMGFMFIFTSALLFTDIIRHIYNFLRCHFFERLPVFISSDRISIGLLFLATLAGTYAFIEAGQIRSEHVVVTTSKLPVSTQRIRIVQISDVHIGLLLGEKRLQLILNKLKEANPDIIVSTGDLIDGKLNRDDALSGLNPIAKLLASVQAPSGKFAVVGNHEVYAGLPQALAFSRAAGFTMLRSQSVTLANGMTISGVDDRAVNLKSSANSDSETTILDNVSKNSFHVLLKHRPEIQQGSDRHFDLQLSGHVHGGQIFPFNFIVMLRHPIPCGTTTTPAGSRIHVTRGTGTWGPPMRLFVPPEVTVIDIVHQTKS